MKKKVAVVNRTTLKNYGSVLQSYALCEAIKSLGYDSEIIWQKGALSKNNDFRPKKMIRSALRLLVHPSLWGKTLRMAKGSKATDTQIVSEMTLSMFDRFVDNHIQRRFLSYNEMKSYARSDECHKLVCGSDQVWCSTTLYVDPLMYLRFAPKGKRVAYAPSIGRSYIPKYNRSVMRKYISEIDQVSIRESEGARLVCELTGKNVPVVVDPTLLLGKEHWENIAVPSEKSNYILCYFLSDVSECVQKEIIKLAKEHGKNVVGLKTRLPDVENAVGVEYPDAGPAEFLGLVRDADLVITDSYHGMLFSLIFERQFYSVHRQSKDYDQSTRQRSVLEKLGINERYVIDEFGDGEIDYDKVNGILNLEINESIKYLDNALK